MAAGRCARSRVTPRTRAGSGAGGAAGGFAALQQHIDDLTGERFALLRGLDGQRGVTEALTAENQALVEDFNRQVGARLLLHRQAPAPRACGGGCAGDPLVAGALMRPMPPFVPRRARELCTS